MDFKTQLWKTSGVRYLYLAANYVLYQNIAKFLIVTNKDYIHVCLQINMVLRV